MPVRPHSCLAAAVLACMGTGAFAQATATVAEDGRWHAAIGAALSASRGNTSASSITLTGDAVRARPQDKWRISGNLLYARDDGETSGNQIRLATRYDWNFTPVWFTFTGANAERDPIAELARRLSVNGGVGYRFVNQPDLSFNVFGGLQATYERYTAPRFVDDATRERFSYASLILGEESTHTLTETVSARQRLVVLPNLRDRSQYRLEFDSGLTVSMTKSINLNVGLTVRHDSDPGPDVSRTDTLLTTGLSMKFD